MANNYIGCAFEIELPNSVAAEHAVLVTNVHNHCCDEDKYVKDFTFDDFDELGLKDRVLPEMPVELEDYVPESRRLPTTLIVSEHPADDQSVTLYVNAEEADLEATAEWVQHLVRKYNLPPVGFKWAAWCDKPRPGEFSGGAFFITKNEIMGTDAASWLMDKFNDL